MNKNLKVLKFWLKEHQDTIHRNIKRIFGELYGEPTHFKEQKYIGFHVSDDAPTLIAHLDTVNREAGNPMEEDFVISQKLLLSGKNKTILSLASDSGLKCLGTDDRAGVAVIQRALELMNKTTGTRPNLLFTYDEEIGCIGSKQFVADDVIWPTSFFVQFDRRGDDIVFYNTESKPFQQLITAVFDKVKGTGSTSDVRQLSSHYKINGANVSVGYENEHHTNELIVIETYEKTIYGLVRLLQNKPLIDKMGSTDYVVPTVYTPSKYPGYNYNGAWSKPASASTTATTKEIKKDWNLVTQNKDKEIVVTPVNKTLKEREENLYKMIPEMYVASLEPTMWQDEIQDAEGNEFETPNISLSVKSTSPGVSYSVECAYDIIKDKYILIIDKYQGNRIIKSVDYLTFKKDAINASEAIRFIGIWMKMLNQMTTDEVKEEAEGIFEEFQDQLDEHKEKIRKEVLNGKQN